MIKGFRGSGGDLAPVPFECEVFGYPPQTTTGEDMFANTHFLTELEAWESIRRSAEAWVRMSGRLVERAKEGLRNAEQTAALAAQNYEIAMRGYEEAMEKALFRAKL